MNDMFKEALGATLKRTRTKLGFTIREVADKANLSETTVKNIEKGKHNISLITLRDICAALNVNAEINITKSK